LPAACRFGCRLHASGQHCAEVIGAERNAYKRVQDVGWPRVAKDAPIAEEQQGSPRSVGHQYERRTSDRRDSFKPEGAWNQARKDTASEALSADAARQSQFSLHRANVIAPQQCRRKGSRVLSCRGTGAGRQREAARPTGCSGNRGQEDRERERSREGAEPRYFFLPTF
jgi:hypothetical protein